MRHIGLIRGAALAAAFAATVPGSTVAQSIDQKNKICANLNAPRQIEVCTDLINRGGKYTDIYYYNRSDGWLKKRECDLSLADAEQALSLKRDVDYLLRLGVVWLDCKKDIDRSIVYFDDAIRLSPRNSVAYYNRASSFYQKNEYDKALADLTQAIRNNPKDSDPYYLRGHVWRDTEDFDRAIADYSQVLRMKPQNADAYSYRGLTYARANEPAKAWSDLDAALRLDAKNADIYDNRAVAARLFKDFDRALVEADAAVRLSPTPGFYATRGRIWQEKGDLDRALADLDEAVRREEKTSWTLLERGVVLRYRGEHARSIADFDKMLRQFPNDATTYVERGRTHEKMGDFVRARADFERALSSAGSKAKTAHEDARAQLAALDAGRATQPSARPVVAAVPPAAVTPPAPPRPTPAARTDTGRRVALVIGNSAYSHVPQLTNPARDAQAIASALRGVGFQTVTTGANLTREKLVDALRSFSALAEGADWAVVYFAGHGIEVGGVNYLIPVDAKLTNDRDVQFEAISLEQIMATVEGARKIKVVILDACRDNPFAAQMRRTVATRSIGRGLSRIEPEGASLVIYAAKHGQTALDGAGSNSPFAEALTKRIAVPGIEISKLFRLVRDDVLEATAGRQEPFTYGSLPGREDFYFVAGK